MLLLSPSHYRYQIVEDSSHVYQKALKMTIRIKYSLLLGMKGVTFILNPEYWNMYAD